MTSDNTRSVEIKAECVWAVGAELGESPVWCETEGALYFVDIYGDKVHRFEPEGGARQSFDTKGQRVSALVPRRGGGFLASGAQAVGPLDLTAGRIEAWHRLSEPETNRLNDGKCDPKGRFYTGTMDESRTTTSGCLYLVEGPTAIRTVDTGYTISNGPAFSPDGSRAYHAETSKMTIFAFDVAEDGSLENKREFLRFDDGSRPDGMTTDSEGYLWATRSRGSRVTRFSPDGRVDMEVQVAASKVTSVAFGGPDYRTLFITSLRVGLDADTLRGEPLAGGLFSVRVPTPGLPPASFNG